MALSAKSRGPTPSLTLSSHSARTTPKSSFGRKEARWGRAHVFSDHKSSVNSDMWGPHKRGLCLAVGLSDGTNSVYTARSDGMWDTARINLAHPVDVTVVSWAPVDLVGLDLVQKPETCFSWLCLHGQGLEAVQWGGEGGLLSGVPDA